MCLLTMVCWGMSNLDANSLIQAGWALDGVARWCGMGFAFAGDVMCVRRVKRRRTDPPALFSAQGVFYSYKGAMYTALLPRSNLLR
jgi:hypothetical protein